MLKKPEGLFLGIAIIVGAIILGISVIYAFRSSTPQVAEGNSVVDQAPLPTPEPPSAKVDIEISKSDHIRGNFDSPVTIVEFSDFQCPFCKRFHATIAQAFDEYKGKIRWVYKHFPLDSLHSQARLAAEGSECANDQGKFWEYVDQLYEGQSEISKGKEFLSQVAADLGLNVNKFEDCLDSGKYKEKVEQNVQEGVELGVRGTPASFINGERVVGAVPYENLKIGIDNILSE